MEHSPVEVALLVAEGLAGGARRQGEHEWFGTPFHRMAIAGPKPEGLSANPRDRRPVNTGRGRRLLAGSFQLAGADMTVGPQGDPFDRPNPNRRFADALHRFGWMGDLLTEGEAGARQGLKLFLDWRRAFGKWNGFSWSARVLERRVFNLACAARRLAAAASEAETAQIAQSLARQARHLISIADQPGRAVERAVVAGIAGCALAGQAGEKLIDAALGRLKHDLAQAVGPDGVHASRCPETGLELLFDLLTLDEALDQRGRAGPEELTRTIDRLATATRFFTLADGRLAAAQGGEAASAERIKAALAHDEDGAAPSLRAAYGGYQRIESAQIQVIADAAAPARGRWGETACGQTLAIEVLCGRDRLITNCAWSPEAAGPQALRLTDAASTASLADHSAGEPLRGLAGFGLGPRLAWGARKVEVRRHDTDAGVWLEMTHDGWAKRYGLIHERKLFLDLANGELRGEDGFIPVPNAKPSDGPRKHLPFAVRFHLHPDARASLARDGKSILLRGASDEGWWLRDDAIEASIEASAHFEAGAARRASQIVLRGQVRVDKGGKLRWKLSRAEG